MRKLLVLAGLGACGGGAPAAPVDVTVHTGSALLVDAQIDGHWRRLAPNADETFTVDAPYAIASVCGGAAYQQVITWLLAPDDGADLTLPCAGGATDVVPVAVTSAGDVSTKVAIEHDAGLAPTTLYVSPGPHAAIALEQGGLNRYAVVRDFEGANLDVDLTAAPSLETRDVSGAPDGFFWSGDVQIGDTRTPLPTASTVPLVVPDRDLADGDVQRVLVIDSSQAYDRVPVPRGGGAIEVDLPSPMTSADLHLARASWSAPDAWTKWQYRALVNIDNVSHMYLTTAFPGWTAAAGDGSLTPPDPTTMPGWDPTWAIDPASCPQLLLDLYDEVDDTHVRGVTTSATPCD